MKRTSYICILLAGALWGITGFFFRHLTALGFGSMEAVVMRIGFAAVLLFLILLVKEPSAFRVRMKDLWCMVGAGTACLMMFICYFKAMEYASLAVAVVLLYTAPGFVVILSALFFKEKITRQKLLALAALFGGCICSSGMLTGSQTITACGFLIGVASGFSYSFYSIFSRFALDRGYSPYTITFYAMLFGSVFSLFAVDLPAMVPKITFSALCYGLGLGFFCCVLPYVLYNTGMRRIETGEAAMLATSEPVVASFVGVFLFAEPMTVPVVLGVMLIVMGILIMNH